MTKINLIVFACLVNSSPSFCDDNSERAPITPTLLSTIDPKSKDFINALDNPLYIELKKSIFVQDEESENSSLGRRRTMSKSQILANVTEIKFGDALEISWDDADDEDIIGLYCPAEETDPKKFRDAVTVLQAKEMGRLTNEKRREGILHLRSSPSPIRTDRNVWHVSPFPIIRESSCEFRHWKRMMSEDGTDTGAGATPNFALESKTNPIAIQKYNTSITGIHLSVTNRTNEMRVHFTTGSAGTPYAIYGKNGTSSTKTEFRIGSSDTYRASDMCQSPAKREEAGKFVDPGMLHTVTLDDLDYDTTYWYKVGVISEGEGEDIIDYDDELNSVSWSDAKTFVTEPYYFQNYSFIVYGDQGAPGVGWDGGYLVTTNITAREVVHGGTRIVHIIGDVSYASGAGHVWDSYMEMIQPFAARVPIMAGVGECRFCVLYFYKTQEP